MNCSDAQAYMMMYLDKEMTAEEAKALNQHLLQCCSCAESFQLYDNIASQLCLMPQACAPAGFEESVLNKIIALQQTEEVRFTARGRVNGIIGAVFAILFSTGMLLIAYREPILQSLSNSAYFGSIGDLFLPVSQSITQHGQEIRVIVEEIFLSVNQIISNSMVLFAVVLAGVCAIQLYLLHKKGHIDKADTK